MSAVLLLLLPGRGGVQLELHLLTAPPPAVYCPLASCALLWEQLPGAGGRWWLQWLQRLQCPAVNTHRWSRPLPSGHNTGPVLYCAVLCCTVLYRADTVMSYPAIIMISGAGLPEYEGNILHAQYILHKIINLQCGELKSERYEYGCIKSLFLFRFASLYEDLRMEDDLQTRLHGARNRCQS